MHCTQSINWTDGCVLHTVCMKRVSWFSVGRNAFQQHNTENVPDERCMCATWMHWLRVRLRIRFVCWVRFSSYLDIATSIRALLCFAFVEIHKNRLIFFACNSKRFLMKKWSSKQELLIVLFKWNAICFIAYIFWFFNEMVNSFTQFIIKFWSFHEFFFMSNIWKFENRFLKKVFDLNHFAILNLVFSEIIIIFKLKIHDFSVSHWR